MPISLRLGVKADPVKRAARPAAFVNVASVETLQALAGRVWSMFVWVAKYRLERVAESCFSLSESEWVPAAPVFICSIMLKYVQTTYTYEKVILTYHLRN